MNVGDERSRSVWMGIEVAPDAPFLNRDEEADVVVVGSGIAGLSVAYELAAHGRNVVVLDRGRIGLGMTARTTAHLASSCDDFFSEMIRLRGLEAARMFHASHAAAIDRIEEISGREDIDCDFRRLPGYLFPALGRAPSPLEEEFDAARQAGAEVEWGDGLPFNGMEATRCLRFARQGAFHPLFYLRGLAAAIRRRGGRLYSDTRVDEIDETKAGVVVTTGGGRKLKARSAVVATNSPIHDRVAIHTKQAPYRTYAIAVSAPGGTLEDALFWDTLDPYHYVRLHSPAGETQTIIVGGADHKTGEADDASARFEALEAWTRNLLPRCGEVTHRWSGQVMEPIDDAGFIGRNPGSTNVYVATGDSGQGMTHGVLAGLLIGGLVLGGEHPWSELYDPSRKTLGAMGEFISENVTAVKALAERMGPGELASLDDLKPGCGAIVRRGLERLAAYRDEGGALTLRSAVCTHLGCSVHWNSFEGCWDCPCHGSQFAVDGTVLNGPAITPLAQPKS